MSEEKKTALVTGAGGFVGSCLVAELARKGHRVRALVREQSAMARVEGVEYIAGDIRDNEFLARVADGAHWVFHFAALAHRNDPEEELFEAYGDVNVESVEQMIRLTDSSRELFLFPSTITVYGPSEKGGLITESGPLRPSGIYAETKARAEEIVRKARGSVILRFPAIYGKGMKGNIPLMVDSIRRRRFVLVGGGTTEKTLIHVQDAVRAILLCASNSRAIGETYNVTDGRVHTVREIASAISVAMGRRPLFLNIPESSAPAVAEFVDRIAGIAGYDAGMAVAVKKVVEDFSVSGQRFISEMNFEPKYGLAEGWREALEG